MEEDSKIFIAGHTGMVGSAILRALQQRGHQRIVTRTSAELDLRSQAEVDAFFQDEKPEFVFLAAAKVGGIMANDTYPGTFLYDNLMIQTNVIHAAHVQGVEKLLFLGSSCIYPKMAAQPLSEDALLTGPLEPTNAAYAIAKITGIKLCDAYRKQYKCNFISAMPTNLYGPNDNYDLETSHVLPALLRKFHEAKMENATMVTLWGTGAPLREFMHVEDLADACLFLMSNYNDPGFVNVGVGYELSILQLATMIKKIVGYIGDIEHDLSKPDGTPRKLMDISKLKQMGWEAKIRLEDGIRSVYTECVQEPWY
ncbi:MAG: GDP-L-fucose synthase [Saprospiraceae bacterium]|nr:GDP-L-fucose synthase [Saprospiraceae bacterium]